MPDQSPETVLLAWNPGDFPWGTLQDELAEAGANGSEAYYWSVGNRKRLSEGTRFFLIRLGSDPRGIVGSGWTASPPRVGDHWNRDRAAEGKTAMYVGVDFDVLEHTTRQESCASHQEIPSDCRGDRFERVR